MKKYYGESVFGESVNRKKPIHQFTDLPGVILFEFFPMEAL